MEISDMNGKKNFFPKITSLPSLKFDPKMTALQLAALILWIKTSCRRFVLRRAPTKPALLKPSQIPTYSGRLSIIRPTLSSRDKDFPVK